ncbi:MAG TPA: UDP-2,3-diacylglucosamine diphosphatase [Gemmatimonadaceae bacterium]|jgi:UDP-2,3-diacylglucosamine hydrolase|nr:UDP-2,3-diacylglucosamine diphosphatase [Gemmatimonadaceae bacterium]
MLPAPCYVFSDAHLGAAPEEAERSLVSFLRALPDDAKSVVINGDLFDFWFEWRHVVPRAGVRVLGEIAHLVDRGIPVLWIAGNHDCWGGEVLTDDIGATYRIGEWRGSIAGWDTLIEHGDGLREVEDRPYRRLRAVLRHPLCMRMFRWIHPDMGTWIAMRSSHTSRNMRPRDGGEGLRKVAHERLSGADAPKLLVYGHSHVTTLERVNGSVFANPGAWMDAPHFLRVTPERVELCLWTNEGRAVEESLDR